MSDQTYELHGVRVLECAAEGKQLRSERDAVDLVGVAWQHKASFIVIPVARLADDFFQLKTRIAGEMIHKLSTYKLRVAIVGDISRHLEESSALRDFVYETNRGNQVWFVADQVELEKRLGSFQI
jgi:hypothetical protein